MGDRRTAASALTGLARSLAALHRTTEAAARYEQALCQATAVGDQYARAGALYGLAEICHTYAAREHRRRLLIQALDIYTQLGVPEAEAARARLSEIG